MLHRCTAFTLLVLSLLLPLAAAPKFADRAIEHAYELFIPIACTNSEMTRFQIGTGFPVGKNLVMTAKHVDCVDAFGEGAVTEISNDHGQTWQPIPAEQRLKHPQLDVQIFIVDGAHYKHVAEFRDAVIGESVAGYGIAFNETSTAGFVMKSGPDGVFASNAAIGGMSGSALVAKDGKVVGMVIQGRPTILGGDIASSWVSYAIPGPVLRRLIGGVS
jgi:hypothetical protein